MPKPKPTAGSIHTCQMCGKVWTRYHNLGKPKWCSEKCGILGRFGAQRTCARCGKDYFGTGKVYCSRRCAGNGSSPQSQVDGAGLRAAYDGREWRTLADLIRGHSTRDEASECWLWNGRLDRDGYGVFRAGKSTIGAHRAMLAAKQGAYLGGLTAHHACAVVKSQVVVYRL